MRNLNKVKLALEHAQEIIKCIPTEALGGIIIDGEPAELEKPADVSLTNLVCDIRTIQPVGEFRFIVTHSDAEKAIQQYAESYHAKRCGECKRVEPFLPYSSANGTATFPEAPK